jgi:hypothetical protein
LRCFSILAVKSSKSRLPSSSLSTTTNLQHKDMWFVLVCSLMQNDNQKHLARFHLTFMPAIDALAGLVP